MDYVCTTWDRSSSPAVRVVIMLCLIFKVIVTMLVTLGILLLVGFLLGLAFVIYVIREVMRDDKK